MSKNLTRKGLALGALVALGSTVIAGPAYAIDPVSLAPSAGTTYTTILGETFQLSSQFTDAAQLASENLKFLITDSSAKLNVAALSTGTQSSDALDTNKQVVVAATNVAGDVYKLNLGSASTTGFSVTVQAWLDYTPNGVIDSGESVSAVRTVKFVKLADAGLKTTLSAIALDDTSVSASITFNSDVNVNQIAKSHFEIAFGQLQSNGLAQAIPGDSTANWNGTGSTDSGDTVDVDDATAATKFTAKTAITGGEAKIYVAQAVYDDNGSGAGVQTGDPSYYTVSKAVAYTVDAPALTVGDNVSKDGNDWNVRAGTKTISFASKVTKTNDAADAQVAAAGIVATVTISIDTIDADDTISAGDITFAGAKGKKSFTVTSNADGKFLFDVNSLTGKKGTYYNVSLKVPGFTALSTNVEYLAAGIVSAPVDMVVGANAQHWIVKGGTVNLKLAVLDSFGAKVTGKYRVDVTNTAVGTDAVAVQKQFDVVDGYANISFVDGSTSAGNYNVVAKLQVWSDAANNYVDTLSTSLLTSSYSATVRVDVLAVAKTASKVTIYDAVGAQSIDSKDFTTGDLRVDRITATGAVKTITLTGDVTDLLGAAVPGADVTISAPGIQFIVDSKVYAVGSVTVRTDNLGHYSVVAVSHTTGKITYTVTSGSATATGKVTYDAAAATSGTSLVVTAPASALPGKSVTVSAKLTDKWGNAVTTAAEKIAFTYTGAGYYVTKATATDSTGVAEATFITQPSDAGTVKFTVKYSGAAAEADYLTTSASTVFAAAVVVDPSASVATVTVTPAATVSQAGRALDVTVKAVDAAGAAVAGAVVVISSTGAGSLSATSVVTGAAGTATVKLVAGSADLGSAVLTATSNAKSSVPVTVEFGATDASVDIIGKRVYVTTEFAAGKRVTIYDNGVRRYSAIQTSDAEKVVMWNVKAGSHTIVVKISGASSDSVTFLVK